MKTRVDARLRSEAIGFAFRFACEDCAHACIACAPSLAEGPNATQETLLHCSLGYPAAPRREALLQTALELCKAFELGAG